jgi:hypothetical protein
MEPIATEQKDPAMEQLSNQVQDWAKEFDRIPDKLPGHIELLMLSIQQKVEKHQDEKLNKMHGQLEQWDKEIGLKMRLQDLLKTALDNTASGKAIDLSQNNEVLGILKELREVFKNTYLEKNKWTREEAQELHNTLKTDRDTTMRQYQHIYARLQWAIENRHELLKIFREMMEMFRKHKESIISHSIPR